ncbi:MAG: flavodoxin family protein [Alphaproteobacteria bacterium]
MNALFLNCTLKKSPETSHTQGLIDRAREIMEAEGVATETIRLADHPIGHGIERDMGHGDTWPAIYERVMDSDILVIGTPIWLGEVSSIAVKAVERLYATSGDRNDKGQYIYYNRVAGVIATGNEDGGKNVCRSLIYSLQHIGFTVPPQVDAYWVGEAGPGPSYLDAGQDNEFTKRHTRILAWNLMHFARMLKEQPIPAQGNVVG